MTQKLEREVARGPEQPAGPPRDSTSGPSFTPRDEPALTWGGRGPPEDGSVFLVSSWWGEREIRRAGGPGGGCRLRACAEPCTCPFSFIPRNSHFSYGKNQVTEEVTCPRSLGGYGAGGRRTSGSGPAVHPPPGSPGMGRGGSLRPLSAGSPARPRREARPGHGETHRRRMGIPWGQVPASTSAVFPGPGRCMRVAVSVGP